MSRRRIRVVGAMLEAAPGRYLITQRPAAATLPLLWEFPGGRVEEGESDEAALARELREEMGIEIEVAHEVAKTHHAYPGYDVDFVILSCRLRSPLSDLRHLRVNDHRWVTLEEMGGYRFPDADARTLAGLLGIEP